jgi:hypothetical protein
VKQKLVTYDEQGRRRPEPAMPAPRDKMADSVDIPIHVTEPEDEHVFAEEQPTEVFRPGAHLGARARVPSAETSRDRAARRENAHRAGPPPSDWEGETFVKRPEAERPSRPGAGDVAPHGRSSPPVPPPFNPDETMKLDNTADIEIVDDFRAHRRRR